MKMNKGNDISEEGGIDAFHPNSRVPVSFVVINVSLAMGHIVLELSLISNSIVKVIDDSLSLLHSLSIFTLIPQSSSVLINTSSILMSINK